MPEICNHPDGIAGAHGLPGTRNAADHSTKERFSKAVAFYQRAYEVDQSTAISLLLDAASRWEKFTKAFPSIKEMQILPAEVGE